MLGLRKKFQFQSRAIYVRIVRPHSKKNINHGRSPSTSRKPKENSENIYEASVESAALRLNKLLAAMQTEETKVRDVKMAKPGENTRKRQKKIKHESENNDMIGANKLVAEIMDVETAKKQFEMKLLSKLLNKNTTVAESQLKDGKFNAEQSLSELMASMKVDNRELPRVTYHRHIVRSSMQPSDGDILGRTRHTATSGSNFNLFGGHPLGIFKHTGNLREMPDMLSTWSQLQKHALKLKVMHPAINYYDKVAKWTEDGLVWQFPVNNEQGLELEQNVEFADHIFLEQHLEDWCPDKGPIRHYMELVCVGLSKNPFITAKEKKDHILWYQDYFESKKGMLKQLIRPKAASVPVPRVVHQR